ncbi:DNA N-6-adenine-methyltransferase [Vibrio phage 1.278.O._10N.286.54.E8]|nr:DNA N-6-adenine-methyltransferase [Vibrio phage 1.278.O._10N.286.54.E8]
MTRGYTGSQTPVPIRDLWRTPKPIFDYYDKRFGFDCDVAASFSNAFRPYNHFGEQYDGTFINALDRDWGAINFLNPPYSDISPWVLKAIEQLKKGKITVMLIPADTSVKWFKLAFENCSECHFISGRLAFINEETGKPVSGNNKGSVVFVFDPNSPFKSQACLIDRNEMMRDN